MFIARPHRSRRGVILLVVLGLLTLFTLIVISFVVVATTERRGVMQYVNVEANGAPSRDLMNQAFNTVVRGSENPRNAFSGLGLLEDVYGTNNVIGTIPTTAGYVGFTTANILGAGTAFYFDVYCPNGLDLGADGLAGRALYDDNNDGTIDNAAFERQWPGSDDLRPLDDVYTGRIITMLDGKCANKTSRILRYQINEATDNRANTDFEPPLAENTARFWVMAFDGMTLNPTSTANWDISNSVAAGDRFVINGAPFNGLGAGVATTPNVTAVPAMPWGTVDAEYPAPGTWGITPQQALLPNRSIIASAYVAAQGPLPTYPEPNGVGGANEDYDAPDFQNLHLAGREWNAAATPYPYWHVWLPSYHRPELLAYWQAQAAATFNGVALDGYKSNFRRMLSFRPDPTLHFQDLNDNGLLDVGEPDFTGKVFDPTNLLASSPTAPANLLTGPWDVDNDGDGVPDSVWVDIGLPVQTYAGGKLVKPLVAILCLDQDGRLNLNAHGNPSHYKGGTPYTLPDAYMVGRFQAGPGTGFVTNNGVVPAFAYAGTYPTSATVMAPYNAPPRFNFGLGFSPADINLGTLFGQFNSANGFQAYRRLLEGDPTVTPRIAGRYGEVQLFPSLGVFPRAGRTLNDVAWYGTINLGVGNLPGNPYVDDDMDGGVDEADETLWPGSDDIVSTVPDTVTGYQADDNMPMSPSRQATATGLTNWAGNVFREGATAQFMGLAADLRGDGFYALDYRGAPISAHTGGPSTNGSVTYVPDSVDEPTEFDLSRRGRGGDPAGAGQTAQVDAPFEPVEAEILYRWNDGDRDLLAQRLRQLMPALFDESTVVNPGGFTSGLTYQQLSEFMRGLLTTESWDIPAPHVEYTKELALGVNGLVGTDDPAPINLNIKDLFIEKIRQATTLAGSAIPTITAGVFNPDHLRMALSQVMGPDWRRNQKLDLNRPFGDGFDNDADGAIDEPGEVNLLWSNSAYSAAGTTYDLVTPPNPGIDNTFTDLSTSPSPAATDYETREWTDGNTNAFAVAQDSLARQAYARELYVMMMLLKDRGYAFPFSDGTATGILSSTTHPLASGALSDRDILTAYRIAQWAINCADFRDADSIMSPFEFDIQPFLDNETPGNAANGTWDVDGWVANRPDATGALTLPSTDDANPWRGLVWGCEQPDLLLTETAAMHDRRTQNTNLEGTAAYDDSYTYDAGNYPPGVTNPDPDFDQAKMPQGSAFIELYCAARPTVPNRVPSELYSYDSVTVAPQARYGIDLEKLAPPDALNREFPVWRLIVTAEAYDDMDSPNNFAARAQRLTTAGNLSPDAATFEHNGFNLLDATDEPTVERIVWFTRMDLASNVAKKAVLFATFDAAADPSRVYYNRDIAFGAGTEGRVVLCPGEYAIVGPARYVVSGGDITANLSSVTNFGWSTVATAPNRPQSIKVGGGNPSLAAVANRFAITNNDGTAEAIYGNLPLSATPWIKAPVGIPVAGTITSPVWAAQGWTGDFLTAGFSISEPLLDVYYPPVAVYSTYTSATATYESIDQYSAPNGGAITWLDTYNPPRDNALDEGLQLGSGGATPENVFALGTRTIGAFTGETGYKTVALQRLANPTQAYNAQSNPYRTVDWMPIDLTQFNGEPNFPAGVSPGGTPPPTSIDPRDPNDPDGTPNPAFLRFWTREREGQARTTSPVVGTPANLYRQADWGQTTTGPQETFLYRNIATTAEFKHNLVHTLGFVNSFQHDTTVVWNLGTPAVGPTLPRWRNGTAADVNSQRAVGTFTDYIGSPIHPHPWLTWTNRDFASPLELMLVPAASAGRLMTEFNTRCGLGATQYNNHFNDMNAPTGNSDPPFGHLLNFFFSSDIGDDIPANTYDPGAVVPMVTNFAHSNFHRLFEYVQVPSRFSGTADMLNPNVTQGGVVGVTFGTAGNHPFTPPYNYVPRFREPGKVNLNTIVGSDTVTTTSYINGTVLSAMLGLAQEQDPTWANKTLWQRFIVSRRGYDSIPTSAPVAGNTQANTIFSFNSSFPTMFSNPFRSYSNSYNVPVGVMRGIPPNVLPTPLVYRRYVDGTLLRPDDYDQASSATFTTTPSRPLLAMNTNQAVTSDNTSYTTLDPASHHDNSDRNAYFRYQAYQKLGNTATTRSNVHAIWITLGYFEVERVPSDPTLALYGDGIYPYYPDGYRIVREVSSDTGELKRSRSFYLHDRTIPVGFIRGENLNTGDGVLLERNIE